MIENMRVVQDHGWIQNPDGTLSWGPTKYWLETCKNGIWTELSVIKINEFPRPDDPLLDESDHNSANVQISLGP